METEIVTLLKVPVKVVCFGGVTPSRIVKDPSSKPNELVLVIPGNPGLVGFYIRFCARIHEKTKLPVWVVSHGGHEQLPGPALKSHKDLYNLQGQCRQKQELIETYLKGIKLRCVGHSIGAKVISNLMQTSCNDQIEGSYFVFPTLERMAVTQNGVRILFICQYLTWLLAFGATIFGFFPRFLQSFCAWAYLFLNGSNSDQTGSVVDLIEPRVIRKILFLAHDEMKTVLERDDLTLKKNLNKVRLYFGATDGWTPVDYYEDLVKTFPELRATLDNKGLIHSFVLKFPNEVGDIVSDWISNDIGSNKK